MTDWIVRLALAAAVGLAAMTIAAPAHAQGAGGTPTGKFLKAVRDEDGTTVTNMLRTPGTTIVNARDVGSRETALEIVISRQDVTWLGFLLGQGADPNLDNSRGDPPILQAVEANFVEGVSRLLRGGARVDATNRSGETALIRAVQRRNVALVQALVAGGADPDRRDVIAGRSARDYARAETRVPQLMTALETAKAKPRGQTQGPRL